MTRKEIEAALVRCEGHSPGRWKVVRTKDAKRPERYYEIWTDEGDEGMENDRSIAGVDGDNTVWIEKGQDMRNVRLIALAPALASALREAWAEIDRLKAEVKRYDAVQECTKYPLDAALNEGDGTYKP
jgi:hypothetical protein